MLLLMKFTNTSISREHFCSIASIPGMLERTITVNGVAKAFAMTGWRIGYIGAPEFIAKACTKIQGQVTSGANRIAQRATITAVDADPSVLNDMVEAFHSRRDLVVGLIKEIPGCKNQRSRRSFLCISQTFLLFLEKH